MKPEQGSELVDAPRLTIWEELDIRGRTDPGPPDSRIDDVGAVHREMVTTMVSLAAALEHLISAGLIKGSDSPLPAKVKKRIELAQSVPMLADLVPLVEPALRLRNRLAHSILTIPPADVGRRDVGVLWWEGREARTEVITFSQFEQIRDDAVRAIVEMTDRGVRTGIPSDLFGTANQPGPASA